MGGGMSFYDIQKKRINLKNLWDEKIPSVDELFEWAKEANIHIHLKYSQQYEEKGFWSLILGDSLAEKQEYHNTKDFDDMFRFIHRRLKEL